MITTFRPGETNFNHNGIMPLWPSECTVTQEINGQYELTLTHPIDSAGRWRTLGEMYIIRAPTPGGEQLFRIYQTGKKIANTITVHARHVFYDGLFDLVPRVQGAGVSADAAMRMIDAARVVMPGRFAVSADMPGTVDVDFTDINPVQAWLDARDGVAAKAKGEVLRDNFTVRLVPSIGTDQGVQIRYRKNLTGLDFETDISETITRMAPKGTDADGNPLYLPERYVDSAHIDAYPFPLVRVAAMSDIRVKKAGNAAGEGYDSPEAAFDAMRAKARQMYADGADMPRVSAKIEFVLLGDTVEYQEYRTLETVALGDTITVIHEGLGVHVRVKVTRYTYDALRERYTRIDIGQPLDDIARIVGSTQAAYGSVAGWEEVLGRRLDAIESMLSQDEEEEE